MVELEKIISRRSYRKFLDKDISIEMIHKLIDCGRNAPFGGPPKPSCQVSEFIIIKDKETMQRLAFDYEDRQFIVDAPVIIACCGNKLNDPKYKEWLVSTSLSIQNILIGAEFMGLGACFVSCFLFNESHKEDKQKLREILNLPENIELVSLIALGYKDKGEILNDKKIKDFNDAVYYNSYGNKGDLL